ncbi:WalW protein [Azospirillaceae bacterium]
MPLNNEKKSRYISPHPSESSTIVFPQDTKPHLLVFIDAEEEFDWKNFSPDSISVRNMAEQYRAQNLFEAVGCVPTYLVDYPVASQAEGVAPLREWVRDGRCLIGAQLHPWVTPPFVHQKITPFLTFAGNLDRDVELAKLTRLTETIRDAFELQPTVYRAGRYGVGPHTTEIIRSLGYQIDVSVLAEIDFRRFGGPSFVGHDVLPYWLDRSHALLEIPLTSAYIGVLRQFGAQLYPPIDSSLGRFARWPAILARTGLLNRVRLSPEGQTLREAIQLTLALFKRGVRVFSLTYHSSSLLPNGSPYTRTTADVQVLLDWLAGYLDFFIEKFGGTPTTPLDVHRFALSLSR